MEILIFMFFDVFIKYKHTATGVPHKK